MLNKWFVIKISINFQRAISAVQWQRCQFMHFCMEKGECEYIPALSRKEKVIFIIYIFSAHNLLARSVDFLDFYLDITQPANHHIKSKMSFKMKTFYFIVYGTSQEGSAWLTLPSLGFRSISSKVR